MTLFFWPGLVCPGILFQSVKRYLSLSLSFHLLFSFSFQISLFFRPSLLQDFPYSVLIAFYPSSLYVLSSSLSRPPLRLSFPLILCLQPSFLPSRPSLFLLSSLPSFLRFFRLPSLPPLPLFLPFSRPEIYYPFDERSQQRYSGSAAALAFSLTPEPLTFLSAVCLRPDPSPLCLRLHPSFPRREEA